MPNIYHSKARHVQPGQQHVFLAVPAGQPVDPSMLAYLWETQADLAEKGIAADLYIIAGHCHVDDARNLCAWEFLKTECSDFVFIDSDTCSQEDTISRLLTLDRDVVAGLYPFKTDDIEFPVRLLDWENEPKYEADGTIEIESAPTGSLRIKRTVLEQLTSRARKYQTKETKKYDGGPIALIFERIIDDVGDRRGGDYNFCYKWRALGGKIHALPDLHFRHYGVKAFEGNFAIHVAKRRGSQTPAFDAAVKEIREGSMLAEPHIARMVADWGNLFGAPPDTLAAAYWMACEASGPIFEAGSGLSTLVLALGAEKTGQTVHSLEHDPDWFLKTRALLDRYGIQNARLHYAPLVNHDGGVFWYALPSTLPPSFEMALIDGPQQRFGRGGVFKVIGERLAEARIIMDDAENEEITGSLSTWAKGYGREMHIIDGETRKFAVSAVPPAPALAA